MWNSSVNVELARDANAIAINMYDIELFITCRGDYSVISGEVFGLFSLEDAQSPACSIPFHSALSRVALCRELTQTKKIHLI
jgi:hypothetical protein